MYKQYFYTMFIDTPQSIIAEYEALRLDDNIAVIGFGEEVKFLHYYSNNYYSIKKCLENIDCCGPSPMEAGIILSYACIKLGGGHTAVFKQLDIRARVVVITDGNPTDMSASSEEFNTSNGSEVFNRLLHLIRKQGKWNPFTFIPVGVNPNYRLLGALAITARGGRIVAPDEARQSARFSLNVMIANDLLVEFSDKIITENLVRTFVAKTGKYHRANEEDTSQICEILNEKEVYVKNAELEEAFLDEELKERYPGMPCLGTRVRRGRDWQWGEQDSHGVGTVVGHSSRDGWMHVEWDNGCKFRYRHGYDGLLEAYDLRVCDEPRVPENGAIAVGCLVRKGPDWQWGDQNGSEESLGTVYRIKHNGVVYVRWPNGNKSNYRFGYKNKYDLILCDPNDLELMKTKCEKK